MKTVGLVSLGCSKNRVDSEMLLGQLRERGYQIVDDPKEAEIIIVNTCGFIQSAKEESIDTLLEMAEYKQTGRLKLLLATGCLAQRYGEELREALGEADGFMGVADYTRIFEVIEQAQRGERPIAIGEGDRFYKSDRVLTTPPYSAYVKISDGCDNRCTYCAIPLIRGRMRSRRMEDVVAEAKSLEKIGVKELNIIAQDTSRYGLDLYGKYMLPELVQKILAETQIPWIRLLYLYPDKITDELVAVIRDNDRVCKYVDLPIQHVNNTVLARMNRHGDGAVVRAAVKKIRREIPGVTLRTTAIVGFPGETEAQFAELCEFVKETGFDRFGAFTYSPEEGTPAAEFPDQIDEQVKQDRYDTLMAVQLEVSEKKMQEKIGDVIEVLCEGYDPVAGVQYGRSRADAPDVDGKVYFTSAKKLPEGVFVNVKITKALDYDLFGEAVR